MAGHPCHRLFYSYYLTALPALKFARTAARSLSDIEIRPAFSSLEPFPDTFLLRKNSVYSFQPLIDFKCSPFT